ncbi:hypothetical protein S245_009552, partial [Arachis hypogaea]
MASMMEQVQIRDSFGLHGLPAAREVQPIKEKPMEGVLPVPDKFYCELCRLSREDP